jgi:hypothetical protein
VRTPARRRSGNSTSCRPSSPPSRRSSTSWYVHQYVCLIQMQMQYHTALHLRLSHSL